MRVTAGREEVEIHTERSGYEYKIRKYNITIRNTSECFICEENEVLLSAMLRSRKGPISHGCFGGGCGVCRMKVVQGIYEKVKRMSRAHVSEADEDRGVVLLCCVQPRGDMIISED